VSLSEEALLAELKKSPKPRGIRTEPLVENPGRDLRPVEKLLIGLLLDSPAFIPKAKREIQAEDFQNFKARSILKRLLEEEEKSLPVVQWINYYKDDPESVRVLSMACAETDVVMDKERTFSDCLSWIKSSRLKLRQEGLRSELDAAQARGDKNRIRQLLYDFNELNRGIKRTYEKK
jgi:hypothetical protein